MQEMIEQLQQQLAALQASSATTSTAPTAPAATPGEQTATATRRPKEKLPTLRTYSGRRSEWDEWHLAALNKIRADGEAIGTPFDQFLYLHLRLEGDSAKTTRAYVEERSVNASGQGQEFLAYLATIYSDPNKKARALQTLHTIQQRDNESFASFIPRFETVLANAGGHAFQPEQCITYLRQALNLKMRTHLVGAGQAVGTTYQEFVNHLQGIGSDLSTLSLLGSSSRAPRQPIGTAAMVQSDTMEWTPTPALLVNNSGTKAHASKRQATWVDARVLAYRREKGLCIRCGNQGHLQAECKFLPARRPMQVNKAGSTTETAHKQDFDRSLALPDIGDSSSESGKE